GRVIFCVFFFFLYFYFFFFFFFFSSRRRHTRCLSDWSSDVCSSDLDRSSNPSIWRRCGSFPSSTSSKTISMQWVPPFAVRPQRRSEERRVGKECRSRWSPDQ